MTTSKRKKEIKLSLLKNPERKEARRKLTIKTKEAWGETSPTQKTTLDEYIEEKKNMPKVVETIFTKNGLIENPSKINPEDQSKIGQWSHITVDCPYCLLHDTMDKFASFIQGTKKYPEKLSTMMQCPECSQKMRLKTLRKVTDMTVDEFAWWFWENVFLYRMMNRVRANAFFNRIKENWGYKDKEIFWDIYQWYKLTDDRHNARKNYEDFMEYKGSKQPVKIEEFDDEPE